MDYIDLLYQYRNRILVTEEVVYEYRNRIDSSSKVYDIGHFDKLKLLFTRIQAEMEKHDVFYGEAREGFYHGYVNKVIGQLYSFVKNENLTDEKINYLYDILSNDEALQYGVANYVCKNQYEDEEIIVLLKSQIGGGEKLKGLLTYISKRLSRR